MVTGLAGAKNGGCSSSQTEQNNITKCYEMRYIPPKKTSQLFLFQILSSSSKDGHGMTFHFVIFVENQKNSKNPVELIILLSRCKCNSKSTSKDQQHSIEMCWCFTPFFSNKKIWHCDIIKKRHVFKQKPDIWMILPKKNKKNMYFIEEKCRPPPKLHVCIHVGEIHVAGLGRLQGWDFPWISANWGEEFHEIPLL